MAAQILVDHLAIILYWIHLTAWKLQFPSNVEGLLWRVSCIDIIMTSPIIISMAWLMQKLPPKWRVISILDHKTVEQYFDYPLCFLFIVSGLSRIYLLVESLTSLRHMPIAVYAAVPWVQNIPHI